jgi:hypothetical protein
MMETSGGLTFYWINGLMARNRGIYYLDRADGRIIAGDGLQITAAKGFGGHLRVLRRKAQIHGDRLALDISSRN